MALAGRYTISDPCKAVDKVDCTADKANNKASSSSNLMISHRISFSSIDVYGFKIFSKLFMLSF